MKKALTQILTLAYGFFLFQSLAFGGNMEIGYQPSADQVPLDPLTIPKYAQELTIPPVFAPTVIRDRRDNILRYQYEVSVNLTRVQMLPQPFPKTSVFGYGGKVQVPGSCQAKDVLTSPGPVFENIRGIPTRLIWRNLIDEPHFLPVDPTLHWANPNAMEKPEFPFLPFPPGYPYAQFPVAHVTHTHGLVVAPQYDGTAEEWFTRYGQLGPSFVSREYDIPNEQPATQLFYHDHTMGITRLGMYSGLVGPAYFIRDPKNPLDKPTSPLPKGEYEIPLVVFDRAFFTDGELNFPRTSSNPTENAYWQPGDGANTVLVNGKVWPNLDVKRRQYRFRLLAAGNGRVWTFQFTNGGTPIPFTIIGADGGYLPAPKVVPQVIMGITERADILVDFSQFAPGTQIFMINAGADPATLGAVMRFTVKNSTAVPPPALPASLFPSRPALPTNAPTRIKTLMNHTDAEGNSMRSVDGLNFTSPPTEFPLIGSTEQWDLIHTGGGNHQIHLHLIEFQVVSRQAINATAYNQQWTLLNGFRPVTRPIVVDPTPYLIGSPLPPEPVETGWKDTVRTPNGQLTRIIARWAPQEIPTGGVASGQNRFPVDVEFPPEVDTFTGPGYVWHCHVLSHEDHDMMRPMPVIKAWAPKECYPVGRVVAYKNINYRVRVAHTSQASKPPNTRFDLWERVNNNDGSWQPQIIYAVDDRVLYNGQLYAARHVHQAQVGQTPPANPGLWEALPMTAVGQILRFCDPDSPYYALAQTGDEAACLAVLAQALADCLNIPLHGPAHPCSGIAEEHVMFTVPDGETFCSTPSKYPIYYETMSKLLAITVPYLKHGQSVTVNGREMKPGLNYPLPPLRNDGYCIKTSGGAIFKAQ